MISPDIAPSVPATSPANRNSWAARGWLVTVAYLVTLGVAEWLLTRSVPGAAAGFGLMALALVGYPAVRTPDTHTAAILPPLLAVPVVCLAAATLRPPADTSAARLVLVAVPTLVAVATVARACPHEWLRLRHRLRGWLAQVAMMLSGVPLGLVVLVLVAHPIDVRGTAPTAEVVVVVTLLVLAVEVLFRGLLIPALGLLVGRKDVPVAAAIYALTAVQSGLATALAALTVGLCLGYWRRRTGSVVGVIGAHLVLAMFLYFVVGSVQV